MKKICILLFVLCYPLFLNSSALAADGVLDQSYIDGSGSLLICTGSRMYQKFKPTKTILTKVEIDIADPSGTVTLNIMDPEGWADVTSNMTVAVSDGWNAFDFENVTVTPGKTYTISVTGDCGPKWKYGEDNPYPDGEMVWQSSVQPTRDFNFMTFGKDEEPDPTPTPTPTPTSEDENGVDGTPTATTGDNSGSQVESDAQNDEDVSSETLGDTSSTIAKPSNLVAKYTTKDKTVVLSWKASSTVDIDGYKIFRSEKESGGYVKVGEVKKDKTQYIDKKPTAGKTLYYQVRAYKGTKQSVSSNTASIKIPVATVSPTATTATAQVQRSFIAKYWPYLLLLLAIVAVTVVIIVKKYILPKKGDRKITPAS